MQGIIQIIIGTSVLSIIHLAAPHHWLPIVAISKAEAWSLRESLPITLIAGFSHTLSTIGIGVIIGLIGRQLFAFHQLVTRVAAPLILGILGTIYIILGLRGRYHHHHRRAAVNPTRTKTALIASLSMVMFLTPCVEIEAYYFTAGALLGWPGITIVSIFYITITIIGLLLLVYLGTKGMGRVRLHFIEDHEKGIVGVVLIVLGLFAYFVEI